MRTGGKILVDQLERNGVELAFCLPGESFLPVLDALYDSPIRLVSCRHEPGAANAAEAYGKLTGRPGVCLVTRGPGATHASRRRAHGEAGLDADAPARRPRAARVRGPRGLAGDRLRARLRRRSRRRHGTSTTPTGSRSTSRARSRSRSPDGRARSCWRCPRTSRPRRPMSPTRRRFSRAPAAAPGGHRAPARAARGRRASARDRRRGRLDDGDERGRARVREANELPGRCVVPLPGLRRQPLPRATPAT